MQRAWKIQSLAVDFERKSATIVMSDGATLVNATFPFDAAGNAPESAVRAQAIAKAREVFDDAGKARIA